MKLVRVASVMFFMLCMFVTATTRTIGTNGLRQVFRLLEIKNLQFCRATANGKRSVGSGSTERRSHQSCA